MGSWVVLVSRPKMGHFRSVLSLFYSFRLRQLCPPIIGLFQLVPGFVEFDKVVPRPLRRRPAQSLQRIRMRPLVRPSPVELRIDPGANRHPLRCGWQDPLRQFANRRRFPLFLLVRNWFRHREPARGKALSRYEVG